MKNLLKKIGVIGLSIAVLAPFIDLPKVEAASDGCKHYLQNYLFLDVTTGSHWEQYQSGGYNTYTSFIYNFAIPKDNEKIEIESVGTVDLSTKEELVQFRQNHYAALNSLNRESTTDVEEFGNYQNLTYSGKYDGESILIHGYWSKYDETGRTRADYSSVDYLDDDENFYAHTIQGAILKASGTNKEKNILSSLNTTISGASLISNSYGPEKNTSGDNFLNYVQDIVTDLSDGDLSDKLDAAGLAFQVDGNYYYNFGITRNVETEALNKLSFGFKRGDNWVVFSTDNTDVKNSYSALLAFDRSSEKADSGDGYYIIAGTEPDINTSETYYWPVVYAIQYKVCPTSGSVETGKWRLEYDANANGDTSVENLPASQTANVGEGIKVGNGPKRTGYSFVEWCPKEGDCYKPGDTIKLNEEGVVTLYAQWTGTQGTTDNSKTGIASYIISFLAVGAIAGGIYYVSKKKNLFKQI